MSLATYKNAYQINPIVLVEGVAGAGGKTPLGDYLNKGVVTLGDNTKNVNYFANFRILPGHTLIDNQVATYPFANQTTAANAVITQPLKLSIEMVVPADNTVNFALKKAVMTNLKTTLDTHTALGGYYNVATPNYIYTGCLLTSLIDSTDEQLGSQVQIHWIWNFMKPLLTAEEVQAAQNPQMSAMSRQTQNTSNPGENKPSVLTSSTSNVVQNVNDSATNPVASNIATNGSPTFTQAFGVGF